MESFYHLLNDLGYTHPVHPTLVYLPIGCVMAAFIFSLLGIVFTRANLLLSAKHCISLALVAVFPTILLGYMDWQHFHGGAWLMPIRIKIILAGILIVLLTIAALYSWKPDARKTIQLGLYTLCFINVIGLGYFGGELVFAGFNFIQEPVQSTPAAAEPPQTATIRFTDVADIFHRNCIRCHKGPGAPYELQLDTYEHVMTGGLEGKVIIPGKPEESELVRRIKGKSKPAMPYRMEPLPEHDIDTIVHWIEQGANS